MSNSRSLEFTQFTFPGGEISVKLEDPTLEGISFITIEAFLKNSADIMALLMITDAIRRLAPNMRLNLHMPYIPYARQDRVCDRGEALAIKVFADLINAQNYSSVLVWDSHSDVALALLDRCSNLKEAFNLEQKYLFEFSDQRVFRRWTTELFKTDVLKHIHTNT